MKEQAQVDAERAAVALESLGTEVTPAALRRFAAAARRRIRGPLGYRRDHLRALAQRVEVADGKVRIVGSRSNLLRKLVASGVAGGKAGVSSSVPKWRAVLDKDEHYSYSMAL